MKVVERNERSVATKFEMKVKLGAGIEVRDESSTIDGQTLSSG